LFEAAAMQAVAKDLMAMKVVELREELAAREEPTSRPRATRRGFAGGCMLRPLCATATDRRFEVYF
jgi:hypothetical protein